MKATEKFGSLMEAWLVGLDTNGSARVETFEFDHCCKEIGFTACPARKLFRMIQLDNRSYMTPEDFDGQVAYALGHDDFRSILHTEYKIFS